MIFVIGLAAFLVAVLLEGYVLSVLWGWFIVPVFSAPRLTVAYAIGLALLVGMLTHRVRKPEDTPETPFFLAMSVINPVIFLVIGWIVKAFT